MAATPLAPTNVEPMASGRRSDAVREAAKWLLSAFAAVFAVLITGLQFSALGAVSGAERWVAIASCVFAFAFTVAVIVRAGRLLADPGLSLDDLLDREVKARTRLVNDSRKPDAPFRTVSSVDGLLARVVGHRSLMHHADPSPSNLRDALHAARKSAGGKPTPELDIAMSDVTMAVEVANEHHFSDRFRSLTTLAAWAASVGAACVVAFALATTGAQNPDPGVSSPASGTLYLARGVTAAGLGMGEGCKVESLPVVIVGGEWTEPLVVSPATPLCRPVQFAVTGDVGVVVPAVDSSPAQSE